MRTALCIVFLLFTLHLAAAVPPGPGFVPGPGPGGPGPGPGPGGPGPIADNPVANAILMNQAVALAEQAYTAKTNGADSDSIDAKVVQVELKNLIADLKALLADGTAAQDGSLARIASGRLDLGRHLNGVPGGDILQKLLSGAGVADALRNRTALDQLPIYKTIQDLLKQAQDLSKPAKGGA
jgi:hypothetical protein